MFKSFVSLSVRERRSTVERVSDDPSSGVSDPGVVKGRV